MTLISTIDGSTIPTPVPPGLDAMTKTELRELIEQMGADWQMLNAIHNSRADDHGWCHEYEQRQDMYNRRLKVLKLVGRGTGTKEHRGREQLLSRGL
jgi:hypothetical protein